MLLKSVENFLLAIAAQVYGSRENTTTWHLDACMFDVSDSGCGLIVPGCGGRL